MTAPAEASPLEARVGHYYQMDGTYLVGREKLREYARAVQDYHPAHWDVAAAAELGYSDVIAPLTFTSAPGMQCNRRMFESIVVGYDTYLQTEEVFEQHRPIVAGDERGTELIFRSLHNTARVASNVVSREVVEILKGGGQFEDVKDLVAGVRGRKVFDDGDIDAGIWTVGTAMGLINDIPTVGELISRIVNEAEDIIAGRLAGMVEPSEDAKVPA